MEKFVNIYSCIIFSVQFEYGSTLDSHGIHFCSQHFWKVSQIVHLQNLEFFALFLL